MLEDFLIAISFVRRMWKSQSQRKNQHSFFSEQQLWALPFHFLRYSYRSAVLYFMTCLSFSSYETVNFFIHSFWFIFLQLVMSSGNARRILTPVSSVLILCSCVWKENWGRELPMGEKLMLIVIEMLSLCMGSKKRRSLPKISALSKT